MRTTSCTLSRQVLSVVLTLLLTFLFLPDAAAQDVGQITQASNVGSGARAMGMGGAFVAVADDATAASWNPAGLTALTRPEFSFVQDLSNFNDALPTHTNTNVSNGTPSGATTFPASSVTKVSRNPEFVSATYPLSIGHWIIVPQFSYRRAVKRDFSFTDASPRPPCRALSTHRARF